MTSEKGKLSIVAVGMAMFSMFFGSGNIIFPVLVGHAAQGHVVYALVGLIVTAVLVPMAGLVALSLFDGKYLDFFNRLGRIPGWTIVLMIMALTGPFAVIPRCIVISHSTLATFATQVDPVVFSLLSSLVIYYCTYKRRRILDVLGLYLTPVLLLSLFTIIVRGLAMDGHSASTDSSALAGFALGLREGYNTMDLFASFMFSSVVLSGIKKARRDVVQRPKELLGIYMRASSIGMGLLALVYTGMCLVAARHGADLSAVPKDQLLSVLTLKILGPYAGIVVCMAVSLACLTTSISLALVFAEFVCHEVSGGRLAYRPTLAATLLISFGVSTLQFAGIQAILVPVLQISLPALMVLTLINFLYKTTGFRPVKAPVYLTLLATAIYQFFVP